MKTPTKNLITSAPAGVSHLRRAGLATEFLSMKEEVTRKRRLDECLRHAQKMEAVGQLAGGVAHDFNNILMAILLGLGMLRDKPELTKETREAIKEIEKETARGSSLTRQLLLFSREEAARIESLSVTRLLNDLLIMLRRLLGENIEISFREFVDLWISADAGMIEQVILNLCLNARDAMPNGGRLSIAAASANLPPASESSSRNGHEARYVCLSFTDTGCGMDEAVLNRIFEPFFTTKEPGKGTGLGLATAYGIVKQHRGWIEVDSVIGRGTSFRVFLPEAKKTTTRAADPAEKAEGGSETILLVEDDASVRRLVAAWLRRLGYNVLEAGNATEASEIWEQRRREIALLFTDMMMPGPLTGLDLAIKLKQAQPALRVISSSGYCSNAAKPSAVAGPGIVYLPKPYAPENLAVAVRQCLDGHPQSLQ